MKEWKCPANHHIATSRGKDPEVCPAYVFGEQCSLPLTKTKGK